MNDATHAAYGAYLRSLADAMLLRDWHVVLSRTPADDDSRAQVSRHAGKNQVEISLGKEWLVLSPEQRRQTATHELLHAHTARLCRTMRRYADQAEGDVVRYVKTAFDDEEEILIDTLARVIAPALPLPPELP